MSYYRFGDARQGPTAQRPPFHYRAAMRTHGNQVIRGLPSQSEDLVARSAFFGCAPHFANAQLLNLRRGILKILLRFISQTGNDFAVIGGRIESSVISTE